MPGSREQVAQTRTRPGASSLHTSHAHLYCPRPSWSATAPACHTQQKTHEGDGAPDLQGKHPLNGTRGGLIGQEGVPDVPCAPGNRGHLSVVHADPFLGHEEGGRFQRNRKWQETVQPQGGPQCGGQESARPAESRPRSRVPGKPRDREGLASVRGEACPPHPQAEWAQGPGTHRGSGDARSRPFLIHPQRLSSPERNESTAPTAPRTPATVHRGGSRDQHRGPKAGLAKSSSPWAAPDSGHNARIGQRRDRSR